jgi:hypothetical protein
MKTYTVRLGIPSISYIELTVQAEGVTQAADLALKAYSEHSSDLEFDTILLQDLKVDYQVVEDKIN